MNGADDKAALKEGIRAFLRAHHVVSLAVLLDGAAHAACVMYALEDLSLYWTSNPGSRHSAAIERDPRVAATVAPDTTDFRFIRGVQIAGRALSPRSRNHHADRQLEGLREPGVAADRLTREERRSIEQFQPCSPASSALDPMMSFSTSLAPS
jgi:uncharacterized protein YhbP (UPF0306 family)